MLGTSFLLGFEIGFGAVEVIPDPLEPPRPLPLPRSPNARGAVGTAVGAGDEVRVAVGGTGGARGRCRIVRTGAGTDAIAVVGG